MLDESKLLSSFKNISVERKIRRFRKALQKNIGARTSCSDGDDGYLAVCRLAAENDEIFHVFKRSRDYRKILEHVTKKQGSDYLRIVEQEDPGLLEYLSKFQKNDSLGSPIKEVFYIGGKKIYLSPTTLRYIKVVADLKNIFGPMDGWEIVEVGAGYGGQCKIIGDVFSLKQYTIVDHDLVVPLIKKYLEKCDVANVACLKAGDLVSGKEYDLVISNYAFSECIKKIQDFYIDKILNNAKRGYITYNFDSPSSADTAYSRSEIVDILSKVHKLKIIEERPMTGPNNCIIIWGDTAKR